MMDRHSSLEDLKPKERVARFEAYVEEVGKPAFHATWPLVERRGSEILPRGTAVPIRIGDKCFVLTAGHVADYSTSGSLWLGQEDRLLRLGQPSVSTRLPPSGNREFDRLDISVFYLSHEKAAGLNEAGVITEKNLDLEPGPVSDGYFLVAGYPETKQGNRIHGASLESYVYPLIAIPSKISEYRRNGLNPELSLLLGFSKKSVYKTGVRVHAPNMHGVSGGGVWRIPVPPSDSGQVKLSAIAIEWLRHPLGRILASRVMLPVSAIWRDHPELRRFLPL